jgi:signal recognition particle subunit SRP9
LRLTDDTTVSSSIAWATHAADTAQCIMYKTFSAIILNRFEALNTRLLSQVANVKPKPRELLELPPTGEGRAGTPVVEGATGGDDPMTGGGVAAIEGKKDDKKAGGGGKKKKKGKK